MGRLPDLWSNVTVTGPGGGLDEAVDRLRADYDETPYTSDAFPQSAPPHLAAIATLFGLDPADVKTARVLEIGCAAGGNLIPFAAGHPQATVVGIDLSDVQIDLARQRVAALGLANATFVAGDIARAPLTGPFDFIVAHGVYSWVPPDVQDALLAAIRRLLAPGGVAYLSYNTYPGWKSKEVMRDAMMLASGASVTPADKVRDAREMVEFLEGAAPAEGVLARVVAEFKARDEGFGDSYVLHDELETFNAPCYFYELVGRAGTHGLAFLAEARPETMFPANHGPAVAEHLAKKCGGTQVLVEQYLDFVTNRMFRESLLVHADRGARIRYDLNPTRWGQMHFAAHTPAVDGPTVLDHSRQEYEVADGATLFTNDPGLKATLEVLNDQWPWTLSRDGIVAAVVARLAAAGFEASADVAAHVDDLLGVLIAQGQARYRLHAVRPRATPADALRLDESIRRTAELTRRQPDASLFNAWHEAILPVPLDRHLLPLLDGTRGRDELIRLLTEAVRDDGIEVDRSELAAFVDATPQRLGELKLLRVEA